MYDFRHVISYTRGIIPSGLSTLKNSQKSAVVGGGERAWSVDKPKHEEAGDDGQDEGVPPRSLQ